MSWVKSLTTREKWLIAAIIVISLIAAFAVFARPAGPGSDLGVQATANADSATGTVVETQQQAPLTVPHDDPQAGQSAQPKVEAKDFHRRDPNDPVAMGEVDAPVVIVVYSDYRCPFCGVFANDTQPQIIENYVNTGKVRLEWRDTPIFGEESIAGAVAARAAGEQGLFWEYNAAVFALAESGQHTPLPREKLLELAEQVGVPDLAKFEQDLDSAELAAAVQVDKSEATMIGVNSTPTFIIGNVAFSGAHPYDVFVDVIEEQLAAVQATP